MDTKTDKLDINYLKSVVQEILNKAHTIPEKKVLVVRPNDQHPKEISFACAICGDSHNRPRIKRAHLYLKNFYVKCYNDDSCSRSFFRYCQHFGIKIDLDKKMEIYNYLDNNWRYEKKEDFAIDNMDRLIDIEEFFITINKKTKSFLNGVTDIRDGSIFHKYLLDRKITNYENIKQGYYNLTNKWREPVIILLNRTADKLLGMQLRNMKPKEKRIYKFCQFQEIYNIMHPDEPLDEIEAISYNKLSSIFNVLNVNFDDTIHVFEGYLDSLFFPNSIALVGLDTDISFLSNENLDLRFILDNDAAGEKKAKQMIESGYSIFLWKRLFNVLSKNKGNKFRHYLDTHVKDINKLAEFYKDQNIYNNLRLDNYFAKDLFDLIDM